MTEAQRPKYFYRIPTVTWFVMAPYWLLWLSAPLRAGNGISVEAVTFLVTTILLPIVTPLVVTTPIWLICRRSQRVASIVFISVLLIYMVPEYVDLLRIAGGAKSLPAR